jgi:hypothetical protein
MMPDSFKTLPRRSRGCLTAIGFLMILASSLACSRPQKTADKRVNSELEPSPVAAASTPPQKMPGADSGTHSGTRTAITAQAAERPPPALDRSEATAAAGACPSAPSEKAWLTSGGCVALERCPGVPGPCTKSCVPFPKQCSGCATCDCVSKALCGRGAASACKGHEVWCAAP